MSKMYYVFNLKILFETTGHDRLRSADIILDDSCPWFVGEYFSTFDDLDLKFQLAGYDTVEEIMICSGETLGIA